MRKIIIVSLVLNCLSNVNLAQKSNLRKAQIHLMNDELDSAKVAIDKAVIHPTTIDDYRTWITRAEIYSYLVNRNYNNYIINDEHLMVSNPSRVCFESYLKAKKLKPQGRELKSMNSILKDVYWRTLLFADADYRNNKRISAHEKFKTTADISSYLKITDSVSNYAAGLSAFQLGKKEVAASFYKKSIKNEHQLIKSYTELVNIYIGDQDYPAAIKLLEEALEKKPNDFMFHQTLGSLYGGIESSDKALESYKKALDINPNLYDANYNSGVIIFNKAVDEENLKEKEKYLKKSLIYFEKLAELKPNEVNILNMIKTIYLQLGNTEKSNEIDIRIKKINSSK